MKNSTLLSALFATGVIASPSQANKTGNAQQQQFEWRVSDNFRLFDEVPADVKARVNQTQDVLANAAGVPLEQHYDELLALISDAETGFVSSAALRTSNYKKSDQEGRSGSYADGYLYTEVYDVEVRSLSNIGAECLYRSAIAEVRGSCGAWTKLAVPSGDGATQGAGATGIITVSSADLASEIRYSFKDELVVALGDSFISGEGNPDVPSAVTSSPLDSFSRYSWGDRARPGIEVIRSAQWWDTPCHRSLLSWPVLSAFTDASRDRKKAVTLVHLGCSGAVIDDLVGRPQTDLPGGGEQTANQLDQLAALLNDAPAGWEKRVPDKVLLSIGGNDIGFVGVLTTLTLPPNGYTIGPLATRIVGKSAQAICPYRNTGRPLSRLCSLRRSAEDRLRDLHGSYHRLAGRLATIGVLPEAVFHAQYPNPLICANGQPCDNNPANKWANEGATGSPNGFEALMGVFPKRGRGIWYDSWNFELQYYPEKDLAEYGEGQAPVLYPELPDVLCDDVPEPRDSEVCQAMLVHYRLNREVAASGFRQISGHVGEIRGHGLTQIGDGPDLSLPSTRNGNWRTGKTPESFEPYRRTESARWFRLPNDSILTQFHFYEGQPRFHHGTVHPTFRAHIEYAQAALEEAF